MRLFVASRLTDKVLLYRRAGRSAFDVKKPSAVWVVPTPTALARDAHGGVLVTSTNAKDGESGVYRLRLGRAPQLVINLRLADPDLAYYATGLTVDSRGRIFVSWAWGDTSKTIAQRIRIFERRVGGAYKELTPIPAAAPLQLTASRSDVLAACADGLQVIDSKLKVILYNGQNVNGAVARDLHHLVGVACYGGGIYLSRAIGCSYGDPRILLCHLKSEGEMTCEISPYTTGYTTSNQNNDYLTPGAIHFVAPPGGRLWSGAYFADGCNRAHPSGIIELGRTPGVVASFVLESPTGDKDPLSWPSDFLVLA